RRARPCARRRCRLNGRAPGRAGAERRDRRGGGGVPFRAVSESPVVADYADAILPGLWSWTIEDPRIGGFASTSHALATDDGLILIDPHRLAPEALAALGKVTAIVLAC